MCPHGDRFGLAVSGGPDSLALLLLAHAAFPDKVEALTVDHGLRQEAAAEAAMVAKICGSLGVPHRIRRVSLGPGNTQHRAREARYTALAQWSAERGLSSVATAHHADDQAETLLMRLNRGSGIRGLSGIRAVSTRSDGGLVVVRPLLGWRKRELERIVAESGLEAASDPSNTDDRFDRARIRKGLADADWLDVDAIARSAGHFAEIEGLLDWVIDREWAEAVEIEPDRISYAPGRSGAPHSSAVRIGIVERSASELGCTSMTGSAAATIVLGLTEGRAVNAAGLDARAKRTSGGEEWIFSRETPRRER
ncbi:tRNA lysidine(34) synthetase TilS [Qipengyuania sp. JC766]|uniref:tRNA lysidine(34) synthetase TilS n=1 Tax=Qipengyuania sp. JC766 TaxID=3232139 RepID=UPI0034580336